MNLAYLSDKCDSLLVSSLSDTRGGRWKRTGCKQRTSAAAN